MDSRTYIRLDDHFDENKKVELIGEPAAWLYVVGLCYCSRNLTDGMIPKSKVPKMVTGRVNHRVKVLLEREMWIDRGDEYEVKDYLLHQRSRAQIEEERRKARERAAKSRRTSQGTFAGASGEVTPPEAEALTEAEAEAEASKRTLAPTSDARGNPDLLWEALVTTFGTAPATKSERGAWNKAAKELRDIGASPTEVPKRVGEFKARFQGAVCTPMALVKHWSSLGVQASRYAGPSDQESIQVEPDPACEHSDPICADCRAENLRRLAEMRERIGVKI